MLRVTGVLVAVILASVAGPVAADDGAEDNGGGTLLATVSELLDEAGLDGTDGESGDDADPVTNGEYAPPYTGPVLCLTRAGCIVESDICADPQSVELAELCQGDPEPVVEAVPAVDPWVLARRALDQMQLATADIHTAPALPRMTYVGLETWLWVPESQWSTLSLSVSAGATTVHVEARPVRADWNLGEGTISCADAGRAWIRGMDSDEETSCGYAYSSTSHDQPRERYPVTATIVYAASWTCVGQCTSDGGSLGEVSGLPGESALRVGERQSVVVRS